MSTPEPDRPTIFISFIHSHDQERRVRELVERLRADGIECRTARPDEAPPAEWPQRTAEHVAQADFVLVVCTETYADRFQGGGSVKDGQAAKWHGAILMQALYEAETDKGKFIPVLWSSQDWRHIPPPLRKITRYTLSAPEEYDALARRLGSHPPPRGDAGPAAPVTCSDPIETATEIPWAVPYGRNPFFTGRRALLEQLRMELTSNGIAGLTQPNAFAQVGGTGKTHTAVEYAYRYRDQYRAVLWASAQSFGAFITDLITLATQLELHVSSRHDRRAAATAVSEWLQHTPDWLLVLDDVEDPKLIEGWLPRPFKGHVLLTLRDQGGDRLGVTQAIEVGRLLPTEAEQLLLSRSGRRDPDPGEARALSQLAGELGGVPLALELAGAYMAAAPCGLQEYLFLYRRYSVDLLEKPRAGRGLSSQPAGIAGLLNLEQVEQRSAPAAELLRASAFLAPAPIPIDLIARGGGELGPGIAAALGVMEGGRPSVESLLDALRHYSLVHRALEGDRYGVHRFVQALVKDQMTAPSQQRRAECVVRAVSRAVPNDGAVDSPPVAPYLPHLHAASELIEAWGFTFAEAAHVQERSRVLVPSPADPARETRHAGAAIGPLQMAPSAPGSDMPGKSVGRPSEEPAIEEAGLLLGEAPCFEALSPVPPTEELPSSEETVSTRWAEPTPGGADCDTRETPLPAEIGTVPPQAPSAMVEKEQGLQQILHDSEAPGALRLASPVTAEAEPGLGRSEAGEAAGDPGVPAERPGPSSEESILTSVPLPETLESLKTGSHDPIGLEALSCIQAGESAVTEQSPFDGSVLPESEPVRSVESAQAGESAEAASSDEELAGLPPSAALSLEAVQHVLPPLASSDADAEPESPPPSRDIDLSRLVSGRDGALPVEDETSPVEMAPPPEPLSPQPVMDGLEQANGQPDGAACPEDIGSPHEAPSAQSGGNTSREPADMAADLDVQPPQRMTAVPPAPVPLAITPPGATEGSGAVEAAARLDQQAAALIHRNRPSEAIRLYKQSLAIREQAFGADHLEVAVSLDNLATVFRTEGRTAEARQCCTRALVIREQALGPEHTDVATGLDHLAALYFSIGRSTEAGQFYKRSLAIREKVLGHEHPAVATSLDNLAALYCALGRYAEAELLCRRSMAIKEKAFGAIHPQMAVTLTSYATILRKWHREAEAEKIEGQLRKLNSAVSRGISLPVKR